MNKLLGFIIGVMVAWFAVTANAEIYQWVDSYGTINFTDDENRIPVKYLPAVQFKFDNDKKWTVDQSDTKAANQLRLDTLRRFNAPIVQNATPATRIVVEHQWRREKRHRSHRHH